MPLLGLPAFDQSAQGGPGHPAESARIEEGLNFFAFTGAQNPAVVAEEFQAVPRRRVMAGGDLDSTCGPEQPYRQSTSGGGSHAQVLHLAARPEQSRQD